MDAGRFDTLTTRLSHHLSRRQGLGVLVALGLGVATSPESTDAKGKKKRKRRNGGKNGGNRGGEPDTGSFPPPPPPPVSCTADTECREDLGEECREGTCQCPSTMVRDFENWCVCPTGTVWCSGACRAQECCSLADCRGNAQCLGGQCVCYDECCKDSECPGNETCVEGTCELCPGCPACPIGSERMQCNGHAGTDCCTQFRCTNERSTLFSWFSEPVCPDTTCLVYSDWELIAAGNLQCHDFPPCSSNAECANHDECLYNPCCGTSMCA